MRSDKGFAVKVLWSDRGYEFAERRLLASRQQGESPITHRDLDHVALSEASLKKRILGKAYG